MAVEPAQQASPSVAPVPSTIRSYGSIPAAAPLDTTGADNPMGVLISGILLLGGIAVFIAWGLTHAYPTA